MKHQLYMTRRVLNEVPIDIQNKIWKMVFRREQANNEDYLHIFDIDIQDERVRIQHTQEIPIFKCTVEIMCVTDDDQFKIYVIRDHIIDKPTMYTMLFANEY